MLPPRLIESPYQSDLSCYWFIWPQRSNVRPKSSDPRKVEFIYEPLETIAITAEYDASRHPDNIISIEWNNYIDINLIEAEIELGSKHLPSKLTLNYNLSVLTVIFPDKIFPDWLGASTIYFTFKSNGTLYKIQRPLSPMISGPNAIYFNSYGEIESLEYTNSAILVNIMNSHTNQFKVTRMRPIDKWTAFFDPN